MSGLRIVCSDLGRLQSAIRQSATILPFDDRARPGEPAAEDDHQNVIARLIRPLRLASSSAIATAAAEVLP